MSAPLADRTVLVTGGSRGIGRAVVEAVHRDGAHVIVHSSRVETGRAVVEALGPERVHLAAGDLAEAGGAVRVWAAALAWRNRIDVLVNNAGAWLASPLDDQAAWDDGWARNLALHLLAPATLCRLAIGHFRAQGGGVIVNVASRSAHRGDDAEHLAYGAAKGGLLALTKGIARGFAAERIFAYAVAPGWVATDIANDADVAGLAATLPMREITPPADVAEVVAFLASGRSPHTTGATIDITGADYVR
jgi:NAD(P)-dependent dehydrogenase (short-subunit alcohol dehydrogenase family)